MGLGFNSRAETEAILSLQNAARKFLFDRSRDRKGLKTNHVTLTSSCEIMKPCQQILRDTYGHCNYPDIMGVCLDHGNRNFCSTHQKLCKNVECKGRNSAMFSKQLNPHPHKD